MRRVPRRDLAQEAFGRARKAWGHLSNDEFDTLMWNCTSYPFGDIESLTRKLYLVHLESGGNLDLAIKQAHDEMDEAMRAPLSIAEALAARADGAHT